MVVSVFESLSIIYGYKDLGRRGLRSSICLKGKDKCIDDYVLSTIFCWLEEDCRNDNMNCVKSVYALGMYFL